MLWLFSENTLNTISGTRIEGTNFYFSAVRLSINDAGERGVADARAWLYMIDAYSEFSYFEKPSTFLLFPHLFISNITFMDRTLIRKQKNSHLIWNDEK